MSNYKRKMTRNLIKKIRKVKKFYDKNIHNKSILYEYIEHRDKQVANKELTSEEVEGYLAFLKQMQMEKGNKLVKSIYNNYKDIFKKYDMIFICEKCNKLYKTLSGFEKHLEKCNIKQ